MFSRKVFSLEFLFQWTRWLQIEDYLCVLFISSRFLSPESCVGIIALCEANFVIVKRCILFKKMSLCCFLFPFFLFSYLLSFHLLIVVSSSLFLPFVMPFIFFFLPSSFPLSCPSIVLFLPSSFLLSCPLSSFLPFPSFCYVLHCFSFLPFPSFCHVLHCISFFLFPSFLVSIVFSFFPCFHPLSCPTSYMSCCANWHHGWVRVFCVIAGLGS